MQLEGIPTNRLTSLLRVPCLRLMLLLRRFFSPGNRYNRYERSSKYNAWAKQDKWRRVFWREVAPCLFSDGSVVMWCPLKRDQSSSHPNVHDPGYLPRNKALTNVETQTLSPDEINPTRSTGNFARVGDRSCRRSRCRTGHTTRLTFCIRRLLLHCSDTRNRICDAWLPNGDANSPSGCPLSCF